ncbi:MAG TPA: DUF5134 domain-containing protein [Pseudonocardia sp.]|jgi:hypothetical protein
MPGWLGAALAAGFALVAVHRTVRRDAPGALMAAGMAVMSLGMAGVGPVLIYGPWWALGFVVVAIWPVVRPALAGVPLIGPERAGPVCGGPLSHLLGGVAMVYMCAMPVIPAVMPDMASLTAQASHLGGHSMAVMPVMPGMTGMASPAGAGGTGPIGGSGPLALVGWALACYFLIGTVTALTRRAPDGTLTTSRLSTLGEATMGFGTVVMLVTMT